MEPNHSGTESGYIEFNFTFAILTSQIITTLHSNSQKSNRLLSPLKN